MAIRSREIRTPKTAGPGYTIHPDVGLQREVMRNLSVSADFVMRRGVGFGAFELFFPDINRWNDFAPNYTLIPTGASAGAVNPRAFQLAARLSF